MIEVSSDEETPSGDLAIYRARTQALRQKEIEGYKEEARRLREVEDARLATKRSREESFRMRRAEEEKAWRERQQEIRRRRAIINKEVSEALARLGG